MRLLWIVVAGLAVCAAATAAPATWPDPGSLGPSGSAPSTVRISVDHPQPGATFRGDRPVFLSGWALPPGQEQPRRDIAIVLDVSESTLETLTGPLLRPRRHFAGDALLPEGSVLAAELAACRALLLGLDLRYTRVAVVTFSGESLGYRRVPPRWRDAPRDAAQTRAALTSDADALERAFQAIAKIGASGMTDMAAGLERATAELVGGPYADSRPAPGAERLILLMTDGVPTLPVAGDRVANEMAVLQQVSRAAAYGIQIHSVGVGEEALRGPFSLVNMAARTGGTFTPIRDPSDLPAMMPGLPLAGLSEVQVRNLTTDHDAVATNLLPDGTFDALVRLAPGRNRIEILAMANDGTSARHELEMQREGDAAAEAQPDAPPLSERLVRRRGNLLEKDLEERREARRAELIAQMEKERALAEARAEEQRREFELRLEGTGPVGSSPPPE